MASQVSCSKTKTKSCRSWNQRMFIPKPASLNNFMKTKSMKLKVELPYFLNLKVIQQFSLKTKANGSY